MTQVRLVHTLRVPDTGRTCPLPAGLGRVPLRHVDDYAARLPECVVRRGGGIMPMWQAGAMLFSFGPWHDVQILLAVNLAAGKIMLSPASPGVMGSIVTRRTTAHPDQPWLDGFDVAPGIVRQFVAMPRGAGATAEEQLTRAADHGGLRTPCRRRPSRRP